MTIDRTYPDVQRFVLLALLALWLFFAAASCDGNDYNDHAATADRAERLLK